MLTKEQFLKDAIDLHIRTETEEIFWKVVDKLIELGFKPFGNNTREYLWFTRYIFLYHSDASIHPRPFPDGKKEIQVSDILGPRFEVGKWYKFSGCREYISRFKTVKNNNFITDTGYIDNGKYKIDTSNGAIIDIDREFTEVSLEKIQQYLPDGHVDLIKKEFILPDKWCIKRTEENTEILHNYLHDNRHNYPEYTSSWKVAGSHGYYFYSKPIKSGAHSSKSLQEGFTEITLDQFKQYVLKEFKPLTIDDLVEGESYSGNIKMGGAIIFIPNKFELFSNSGSIPNNFQKGNCPGMVDNIRQCTSEEKQWLNVCIAENKFIEKDYALRGYDMYGKALQSEMKQCVITSTQEEWSFCLSKCNQSSAIAKESSEFKENSKQYPEGIAVCIKGNSYCRLNWFRNNNYQVISFQEWLDLNDYTFPEEIKPVDKPFEFNKWYKANTADGLFFIQSKNTGYGFRSNHVNYWFTNNGDFEWNINGVEPATDSEVKERLLSYAKEKYPVGTKVKSAQNSSSCWNTNNSWVFTELYRLANFGYAVFYEGKWAEIITTSTTKETITNSSKKLIQQSFDRNWYVEVSSQEEADKVFDWLEVQGEEVNRNYSYSNNWNHINCTFKDSKDIAYWSCNYTVYEDTYKKQLSDILGDYKQPIKTGAGLREQIDSKNVFPTTSLKIRLIELKQESKVKLINVPKI